MVVSPIYPAATSIGVVGRFSSDTLEAYCARRAYAYRVGEGKARQREISTDAYVFLYKELVGLAGDRTYCWPGLEYLGERLGTSEGTLKRWLKELERAELIQRKPRPGGQTSLTYITVYLQLDQRIDTEACQIDDAHNTSPAQHSPDTLTCEPSVTETPAAEPASSQSMPSIQSPVFFVPEQEINSDQGARSSVISHTIKTQEFKNLPCSGGGSQAVQDTPELVEETEVTTLLSDEDVQDPATVIELQGKPIEDLRALSRYLDKQKNVRCRPSLFVWLARQDFGAKLVAGRQRQAARGCKRGSAAALPADTSGRKDLLDLWQAVLDQLAPTLPQSEFTTWLEPTRLLEIDGQDVVVETPNIFVRQEIEGRYLAAMTAELHRLLNTPVRLHLIIGDTLSSSRW